MSSIFLFIGNLNYENNICLGIGNFGELQGSPEHIGTPNQSQSVRSNLSASALDLTRGQQHNWTSQPPSFTPHVSGHDSASNWQTNASEAIMVQRREFIQREKDALRFSRAHSVRLIGNLIMQINCS